LKPPRGLERKKHFFVEASLEASIQFVSSVVNTPGHYSLTSCDAKIVEIQVVDSTMLEVGKILLTGCHYG
jgi:hypothetical protein